MRGPSRSFVCSIAKERSGLTYAGLHSQRVRLPGDAFSNFCSGSYGARRFPLGIPKEWTVAEFAPVPQTDRIFGTEGSVLFRHR